MAKVITARTNAGQAPRGVACEKAYRGVCAPEDVPGRVGVSSRDVSPRRFIPATATVFVIEMK